MSNSQELKKGAILSYATIVFNIITGLIYTPWMIKQIGVSDYGLYVLVTSFLTYFIMDFGLGDAVARFISKYRIENDEQKINQILGLTSKIYLYINLCIFTALVVFFFLLDNIFKELNDVEIEKFKSIYIIAGLFSLLSFPFSSLNGVVIAFERFVFLKLCDFINKCLTIVLMVIALYFGYKLYSLVFINALVGIFIIIIKLFYLRKHTNINVDFKFKSKELKKQIFGFSAWVTIIGIAQRLLINISPTLLAIYSGTTAISIFSIGIIIEGYVWTFAGALNGMFLPRVTALNSESNDKSKVTELMIKVGRIQLFVVGLLVIGIIIFGKEFIVLWMGEKFKESYLVVILLVIPGLVPITQNIASTLMYVENKLKYTALIYIFSSIVSIISSIFLIPKFGALGAALGISLGISIFQVVVMNIIYQKVMKINVVYFLKSSFVKMLPLFLIVIGIGLAMNYYIKTSDFFTLFVKAFIIGIVYLALMFGFGLKKEEKDLFASVITKRFN